jgi:hypothetical protein
LEICKPKQTNKKKKKRNGHTRWWKIIFHKINFSSEKKTTVHHLNKRNETK